MPHVYSRSGPSSAAQPAAHRSASVTFPSTLRSTASFGLSWSEVAMIVTTNLLSSPSRSVFYGVVVVRFEMGLGESGRGIPIPT